MPRVQAVKQNAAPIPPATTLASFLLLSEVQPWSLAVYLVIRVWDQAPPRDSFKDTFLSSFCLFLLRQGPAIYLRLALNLSVDKAGLKLMASLLPQSPKHFGYRHAPPHLAERQFSSKGIHVRLRGQRAQKVSEKQQPPKPSLLAPGLPATLGF